MDIQKAISAFNAGDYTIAYKIFYPLAEQGDAVAQAYIGRMYSLGNGVEINNEEAVKWLHKAAEQGNDSAQEELGVMYLIGDGIQQNVPEALKWLHMASEQGNSGASVTIGNLYLSGNHVQKDAIIADKWYSKAYEQGESEVLHCFEIGMNYFNGDNLRQDYTEAEKWLIRVVNADYNQCYGSLQGSCCHYLGQIYLEGLGGENNEELAAKWFCKGAEIDNDCMESFKKLYKKGIRVADEECGFAKLFHNAVEEGDRELQLRLRLRKHTFLDSYKLILFIIAGLITMPLLVWYDWLIIAAYVEGSEQNFGWFSIIILAFIGFFLGFTSGSSITYHLSSNIIISGVPFPLIISEAITFKGDDWDELFGEFTLISMLLNACYFALAAMAFLFVLPDAIQSYFFIILFWVIYMLTHH